MLVRTQRRDGFSLRQRTPPERKKSLYPPQPCSSRNGCGRLGHQTVATIMCSLCHAICTLVMKAVGHLPTSPRRRPNQFPRCRRSLQIVNAGMNTLMAKYVATAVEPNAATAASRRPRSRSRQCQRAATPRLCRGHARVFVLTRSTKTVAELSHLLCGKLTALSWA